MNKYLTWIFVGRDQSLSKTAHSAGRSVETASGKMTSALKASALAFTAIGVAMIPVIKESLEAAQHSNDVMKQTEAVLKSTGNAANVTMKQIADLTSTIMRKTAVDDEAVRSGANMILTFKEIKNAAGKGNDIFNQTVQAVTDMTAAMNGGNVTEENMRKQAIMVGKALNDPIKGMSALRRVGVAFTKQQEEQVKAMVESGNTMDAQKFILKELKSEFGGSAEAYANPFKKMKVAIGEATEQLGNLLLPAFAGLATWVTNTGIPKLTQFGDGISRAFTKALPSIKRVGSNVGSVVMPALRAFGEYARNTVGPMVLRVFQAIGNVLQTFAPLFRDIGKWISTAVFPVLADIGRIFATVIVPIVERFFKAALPGFRSLFNAVKSLWGSVVILWNALKPLIGPILIVALGSIVVAFNTIAWVINNVVAPAIRGIARIISGIVGTFKWMADQVRIAFDKAELYVLEALKGIIHGLAVAMGWVPFGIGKSLKDADKEVGKWVKSTQERINSLEGKKINVNANFVAAGYTGRQTIGGRPFAAGGEVTGPGTSTSDSIPLWASAGEYVVRAASVKKYGKAFFDALNVGRYAVGGLVKTGVKFAGTPMHTVDKLLGSALQTTANSWAQWIVSLGGGFGRGVTRWTDTVIVALQMLGQSLAWVPTVLRRINQESGGNPWAINTWDINWQRGDPSKGLMQTIGATFAAYAGSLRGLGIFHPLANVYAGLHYAMHRYGSLAALNRPGGYDFGGILRPGYTMAYNGTGHNEYVVNPALARSGDTHYHVIVNVQGHTLSGKQELARELSNALRTFDRNAGNVPYRK